MPSQSGQSELNHELEAITLPENSEMLDDLRSMVSEGKASSD